MRSLTAQCREWRPRSSHGSMIKVASQVCQNPSLSVKIVSVLKKAPSYRWACLKGGGYPVFPSADLSTLCTYTHALVGWCSDAVLQWLKSKFCMWIHKPEYNGTGTASQITFAISTCILDNSAERWKRICFDVYYAALLPRRGPHIASHSVCLSVCLSVRTSRYR